MFNLKFSKINPFLKMELPLLYTDRLYSVKSQSVVFYLIRKICLMLPMTLATSIRTFAIRLVNSTSPGLTCFFASIKKGMTNCAPHLPNITDILNPLSTIILSSWFIFLEKIYFSVVYWSLKLLHHLCKKLESVHLHFLADQCITQNDHKLTTVFFQSYSQNIVAWNSVILVF